MKHHLLCTASLLAALTASALAAGGPLTPPAAPAPTMKTLDEIEPRVPIDAVNTPGDADSIFRITAAGSYYLTGNLTGVVGKHGIEIAASGVTIDLRGFQLTGVNGSLDGITAIDNSLRNIAIRNGTIQGWKQDGVDLRTTANNELTNLRILGNTGFGITSGDHSVVTECSAIQNSGVGIFVARGVLSACTAASNGSNGLAVGSAGTITNCSSQSNTGIGIVADSGSTISGCVARGNTSHGITVTDGCAVSYSTAQSNGGNGISATSTSTISSCVTRGNNSDGIIAVAGCVIVGNNCANNGVTGFSAGIHITGADNRIDGNTCTNADFGVDVDVAGNIIVRNVCSGNTTNWSVVTGNICYIVSATTTTTVINGDFGGTLPAPSADPTINLTY